MRHMHQACSIHLPCIYPMGGSLIDNWMEVAPFGKLFQLSSFPFILSGSSFQVNPTPHSPHCLHCHSWKHCNQWGDPVRRHVTGKAAAMAYIPSNHAYDTFACYKGISENGHLNLFLGWSRLFKNNEAIQCRVILGQVFYTFAECTEIRLQS